MEEKEKKEKKEENGKKLITKERIIVLVVGVVVGILLTCLVGFGLDYFAQSVGMAKLFNGEDTLATVADTTISANSLWESVKKTDGLTLLLNEVDQAIIDDMYTLTEEEEEEVNETAEYYIEYYTAYGYTEEEFLSGNGFADYEEFLADIRLSEKLNKYLYDYLENLLEADAVQTYYDENKDSIQTYDSEHILVSTSDDLTEEEALELANEIIAKLDEGATFEEIAEEYADSVTYEELGFQGADSGLEDAYMDELVALEDGSYSSEPIETSYGYHVVHKIATATFEDLRETIIETLTEDLLTEDTNLTSKAFVELREENNLTIYDEELKTQYEEYCSSLYETETETDTDTEE